MRPKGGVPGWGLLAAVALSAAWGLFGLAFSVTQQAQVLRVTAVIDVLRTAAWYGFLLSLIVGQRGAGAWMHVRGLVITALGLIGTALIFQAIAALDWARLGDANQLALLDA